MFSPRHFSIANGYSIGSFEAAYGLVHASLSRKAHELWHQPALAKGMNRNSPEFFRLLMEITSTFHERRHFYDSFGTLAGLSLFTNHQDCIARFAAVSRQLVRQKVQWQLPLSSWQARGDCPQEVKRFTRYLRSYKIANDVFWGNFSGVIKPGASSKPWVDMPVFLGEKNTWTVPAFPLSVGTAELVGNEDPSLEANIQNVSHYTAFQPIGYKSLIEGAAHLMTRTILDSRIEGIDPQFLARYGPAAKLGGDDEKEEGLRELAEMIGTYSAVDLLVSRYLRRYAISQFERRSVFKLIDIALSIADLKLSNVGENVTIATMKGPGQTFVDHLSNTTIAALHGASFDYPAGVDERYQRLLARFKSDVHWLEISKQNSIYAAPYVWRSFLSHDIIVPLLERRLKTRHAIFYKVDAMLENMEEASLPYVKVLNDQLSFEGVPDQLHGAWLCNMMLTEIAHQLFADTPLIRCPRAHHMLPGMKSLDLTLDRSKGSCLYHMDRGCGSWAATRRLPLPDCLFKRTLTAYGFIPIASKT